jgi:hypothetical protein
MADAEQVGEGADLLTVPLPGKAGTRLRRLG